MKKYMLYLILLALVVGCGRNDRHYRDYSADSGFRLENADSAQLENLQALCRVWGFVKFHHPALSKSRYNIDYELFELLPRVITAPTEERNKVLSAWVDSFGKFKHTPERYEKMLRKKGYQIDTVADCRWITDTDILGSELSGKLQKLRFAERKQGVGVRPFHKKLKSPVFDTIVSPPHINDDSGYRLLALFNFWNTIEYFSPYKHLTDTPWDEILTEYLPVFIASGEPYRTSVQKLVAEICDSHGGTSIPSLSRYRLPFDMKFVGDTLIVYPQVSESEQFKPGDKIVSIDGKSVENMKNQYRGLIASSNENSYLRYLALRLAWSKYQTVPVVIERDGNTREIVARRGQRTQVNRIKKSTFSMLDDSVGYLYPADNKGVDWDQLKKQIFSSKALVIDNRTYPLLLSAVGRKENLIRQYFLREKVHGTTISRPVLTLPGIFVREPIYFESLGNEKYEGRIIVLVNSETQSMAEYVTMMMQTQPNVTVIGSQTAGADGNVATVYFPESISSYFSSLGVYYPDGTPTQRTGIKIDHYVTPTIKGIREGRDEVLEKALEILKTN